MKLLLGLMLLLQVAQPSPAAPFPNHETPPVGWHCVPAKTEAAVATDPHACTCLGMQSDPMWRERPRDVTTTGVGEV